MIHVPQLFLWLFKKYVRYVTKKMETHAQRILFNLRIFRNVLFKITRIGGLGEKKEKRGWCNFIIILKKLKIYLQGNYNIQNYRIQLSHFKNKEMSWEVMTRTNSSITHLYPLWLILLNSTPLSTTREERVVYGDLLSAQVTPANVSSDAGCGRSSHLHWIRADWVRTHCGVSCGMSRKG